MSFDWKQFDRKHWRLVAIFLATILVLGLIDRASLLVAPCLNGDYGYSDQEHANDNNCAIREGIVIAGVEWLSKRSPETWTALATLAIAAFTATLWWSTRGLLKATNKTITIASDDLEFTHRARVSIMDAGVHRGFVMEGKTKRDFLRISYTLKNIGSFPATGISESFADSCGPDWGPPTRKDVKTATQKEPFGLIIAPQETLVREKEIPDKNAGFYHKAESDTETFYVRVAIIVAYMDGFNKERTTWKWFEWTEHKTKSLGWYYRECAARQD